MRNLVLVIVVGALAAGGYFFFFTGQPQGDASQMGGAVPVSVAEVQERTVVQWDEFSGRLEAIDRVEVRPRVSGTIEAIHFEEGQMVSQGQPLFTIDPKPYAAALQAAKARAAAAQNEFSRSAELLPKKFISKQLYDDKKSAAAVAAAALTQAQLDMEYTLIKAPVAGRVSRAEITVGNLVSAGASGPLLTTVVSSDPIYADAEVDEQSFVRYLQANGGDPEALKSIPVQLKLSGQKDYGFEGSIKSFDNQLNTRAGTVRVRAVFDNKNGALIPGLYAQLRIGGTGNQPAILINEKSVVTDQDKKVVNIVTAENKIEYRPVVLGPIAEGLRVVRDGLKPGERIVVGGLQRVRPGAQVMPQLVDMATGQPVGGEPVKTAEQQ